MFPNIEVRHLHAVVVLAEEMNFTRAAHRLNISQPALSKQVTEGEEQYGLHLFSREKGRLIELTDAGQVFVEEARAALSHAERAIQLARANQGRMRKSLDGGTLASVRPVMDFNRGDYSLTTLPEASDQAHGSIANRTRSECFCRRT